MIELYLHKRRVESVFNLMGKSENDITFSIGWAFSRSPAFLKHFLYKAIGELDESEIGELVISMQEHQNGSGITDIEIRGSGIHLIIEAKRGLWIPSEQQLRQYLPRFNPTAKKTAFITMAECSRDFAFRHLPATIENIPVKHFSWREIAVMSGFTEGGHAEKHLMAELRNYLATIVTMQKQDSNWVYVVSLGGIFEQANLPFIDIVVKHKRYFHPIGGNGWPKEPPNYLACRYWGKLQSIHHIERAEVIENFYPHIPGAPDEPTDAPLFLYHLGEPIIPSRDIPTGNIYASGRVWAMLDLLLTSETIAAARDASKMRAAQD